MPRVTTLGERNFPAGTPLASRRANSVPVIALGLSLGIFIAVTYVLRVLFDLWFSEPAMDPSWARLLPGFTWINWSSFVLGLIEAAAYGWYIALIFGPLYNYFANRGKDGWAMRDDL